MKRLIRQRFQKGDSHGHQSSSMSAWPVLGAAIVSCTLFTRAVAAEDQEFTVAYRVTTQGLDLNQPAGAHELYSRLSMRRRSSARMACGSTSSR